MSDWIAVEWPEQPRRMPMAPGEAIRLVDAAQQAGKFPPYRRDHWLARVAAGGARAGQAISDLLAMVPADRAMRASWAAAAGQDPPEDPDGLYDALYPDPGQLAAQWARRGREPDWLAMTDARHTWLDTHAAAGDGPDAEPDGDPDDAEGHDATTTPGHYHVHADYRGGGRLHSHFHAHNGDASHEPGTYQHRHGTASERAGEVETEAAAAALDSHATRGIAARHASRLRADPDDPAAWNSDGQLYDRLFGPEP